MIHKVNLSKIWWIIPQKECESCNLFCCQIF